ncbi:MAG: MFS transporter [Sphingomonadales bacterium]|nr:MFS transporter [Sphingomonadales bacterium]MDE2569832.1 MFS transporter [Sphingomonadales bacterium]
MSDPPSPAPESGPFAHGGALAPFRYPAFRAIWIANLFSNIGSMIQSVGAAWLMTEMTSSHRLIALVQASNTLPIMLLGAFAGAIADNFDRRRVMLAAQTGMLLASAVLASLAFAGVVGPAVLLLLTLTVGMGTALNSPAWQASVRLQVGKADLPQAISLNSISFNLARSVGPALGGLLISLWNPSLAFALNAISYVGMIVVLSRWKPQNVVLPERQPMLASILTGVRFCMRSSPLRRVLLRGFAFGFASVAFQAMMPAVAHDRMHGTEIDYGLMLGAFGIGSIQAALWIGTLRRRFGQEVAVLLGTVCFIGGQVLLAGAQALPLALAASLLAGTGWVATLTSLNVAMQLRAPEAILGRCMSIYQAITFGAMAVGAYSWGTLADAHSLPFALHTASGWLAATLLLCFVVPMPSRGEGRVDLDPVTAQTIREGSSHAKR